MLRLDLFRRGLAVAWVIRGIDVIDGERALAMNLDHGRGGRPAVVLHSGFRDEESARFHRFTFLGVELVAHGDVPAIVPPAIIEGLRRREDANGFVKLERPPRFASGDKVRIRDGAFADTLGLFEAVSGEQRVAILLDLLGRKVRVVLDADVIEAA